MAKYRVLENSYIDDGIRDAGEIVDYAGDPGPNLELIPEPPAAPVPQPKQAKPGTPA